MIFFTNILLKIHFTKNANIYDKAYIPLYIDYLIVTSVKTVINDGA